MANENKISKLILAYDVDSASQKKAIDSLRTVEAEQKRVGDSETRLRQHFEQSKQAATQLQQEVKKNADVSAQLGQELAKLARVNAIDKVASDFASARRQGVDLDTALQKVIADLKRLGASDKEIQRVAASLRDAAKAADSIPEPSFEQLTSPIPTSGGERGAFGRSVYKTGRELRMLPSTVIPGAGGLATDAVANMMRVAGAGLEKLGTTSAELFTVLGIGLPAVALAVMAFKQWNEGVSDITAGIRGITARTREYYELLITGSTSTVRAAIEAAETEQRIAQARVDDLRFVEQGYAAAREQFGQFNQLVGGAVEVGALLGQSNLQDIRAAREEYETAQVALEKANNDLALFNGLLGDTSTAANDAAEAQEAYNEWVKEQIQLQTERNIQAAEDVRQRVLTEAQLREGTAEAAEQAYRQLETDSIALANAIGFLKQTGDTSEEAQAKIAAYDAAIAANSDLMLEIAGDIHPALVAAEAAAKAYADALERVTETVVSGIQGIVGGLSAIPAFLDKYNAAVERVTDAQQAYNDALAQGQATVTRLTSESQTRQNAILEDAYDRAEEIGAKYGVAAVRAREDLARELAAIDRRAGQEQATAVGERDALAFLKSQRAEAAAEQEAEEQADVAAQRREEDYRREIDQLAEQADKRLRAERDNLQRQLDQAETAWRAQLATRQRALDAEQAALNAFVNSTVNGMSVVQATATGFSSFMAARAEEANAFLNALAQAAIERMQAVYAADQAASVGAAGTGGGYTTAQYALGGVAAAGTVGMVNDGGGLESGYNYRRRELRLFTSPTMVLNDRQTAAAMAAANGTSGGTGGSNVTLNVTLDGQSVRATSRRQAVGYVDELLREAGVE